MAKSKRTRRRSSPPVIAVINTSDDLVLTLRDALVREGYNVVSAHIRDIKAGRQDFSAFLQAHDPAAIIYDISVPYEDNWTFFQTLLKLPAALDRQFIVTTVNKQVLDKRVGRTEAIEIQGGRVDDLEPVIEAVQKRVKLPARGD
jgi:CheY-like chemotaxis protein